MVKKRKSSIANTPQRDGGNSKKAKINEKAPDENNQQRLTRTATKEQSDDAILSATSNTKPAAPQVNGRAKRTAAKGNASKRLKIEKSHGRQTDESADDESNSTVSIQVNGRSTEKVNGESIEMANSAEADEELNLSEDNESEDERIQNESGSESKRPKKPANKMANGRSKKTGADKKPTKKPAKNSSKAKKEPEKSAADRPMDEAGSENEAVANYRRSARKRVSRFDFKELISSGSSEENSDFEEPPKARGRSAKKVSKKEMRAKIKQFIGDSDDEDDYKPDESEQSDEEEIEEEEELPENESNAESEVSDVLPTKSKYFKKSSGGGNRGFVRLQMVNRSSNSVGGNLSRYQANVKPKSGGCSYNSIGIDSLGTPQSDLLKNKLANCKVPSLTGHVSTKPPAEPQASAFGNGSCVRDLLSSTHITAKYEKYKRKHIAQTKSKDTVGKEDLLEILQEFESGVANAPSTSNEAPGSETDDDDFEEVENAKVAEDFEDYEPECLTSGVTIQVKDNFNPRNKNSKKNVDWIYDAIRQGINRQRREIYTNATKVCVLSSLARAKYLNHLIFDEEIQSLAYSIDFFKSLKAPKSVNEAFVQKFVDKFKAAFEFVYKKDRSQLLTSREAIRKCFETGQTNHPTVFNLIFLVLFRAYCKLNSIEENSRLCIAFRPIDSKCDTLLAKPRKWQGVDSRKQDDFLSEDEKPTKKQVAKKSGAKKGGNAMKGKSKKTKEESEEDQEDEDFSGGESKYFKGKKQPSKASKSSSKSKEEEEVIVDKVLQLNKKNLIELWAEIYLADEGVWYCVEPINEICSSQPEELEEKLWVKPLYVLAFNSAGHLKDLTPKYVASYYLHKFKRLRLEDDWLQFVYSAYRPAEPTQDELDEDALIKEHHLSKPLPKRNADFKNHGLYYLKKDQLKYEVIYPADVKPVGKFHSEAVYLREHVHETHSKEYWKKEARMVRKGEEPAKVTTARPKWDKRLGDWIRNLPLDLYGYWQTDEWDPGEVVDGKVPRNEFGNVDLFKPCMLPRGASYLRLNGLLRIAQRLEVDCVPAVTGFDLKQASTIPLMDGFVVPKEYEEILTVAWKEEQERAILKAEEKYYARVYGNWKRLFKAFLIHKHIQKKYRDGEDDDEAIA